MPTIQIAPPLTFLDRLNRQLDDTLARTDRTIAALDTVRSAGEQAAADHESSMQRIGAAADSAVAAASSSADQVAASGQRAETAAAGSSASVQRHTEEAQGTLAGLVDEVDEDRQRVEDFFERLTIVQNDFGLAFLDAVDAAKAGLISMQEVVKFFGDSKLVLDDQITSVQEAFGRLDLRFWQKEIQELIQRIREGSAELSDVEQQLGESQNAVAQRLLEMIRLVREGSVSLDALRRLVDDISRAYAGTEFDNLAQAVLAGLKDGTL